MSRLPVGDLGLGIAVGTTFALALTGCGAAPMMVMPVPRSEASPLATHVADANVHAEVTLPERPIETPVAPPRSIEADFIVDSTETVHAPIAQVHALLLVDDNLTHVLPFTRSAITKTPPAGALHRVRLQQGTSVVNVEYTLHIVDEGNVVRFHLDKDDDHGIADCEGFFELSAAAPDRTEVRFVDAVDLGKGVARMLFKEQIRKAANTTPKLVRKFVEAGQPMDAPPPNGRE